MLCLGFCSNHQTLLRCSFLVLRIMGPDLPIIEPDVHPCTYSCCASCVSRDSGCTIMSHIVLTFHPTCVFEVHPRTYSCCASLCVQRFWLHNYVAHGTHILPNLLEIHRRTFFLPDPHLFHTHAAPPHTHTHTHTHAAPPPTLLPH